MVLPDCFLDLAGRGEQSGVEHKRQGGAADCLTSASRITTARLFLPCWMKALAKANLEVSVLGSKAERFAKLGLGELGPALREQALGEVPPQRNILGRQPNRLSQGFKRDLRSPEHSSVVANRSMI